MSYICPDCNYEICEDEDVLRENWEIKQIYFLYDNDDQCADEMRSDVSCPYCGFTGIEEIFIPDKLFDVYCKEGKYYIPFPQALGIVTINDLRFNNKELGSLHQKVSIIRCLTSISELPVFLSDDDSVVREEAKKRFQKLGGK